MKKISMMLVLALVIVIGVFLNLYPSDRISIPLKNGKTVLFDQKTGTVYLGKEIFVQGLWEVGFSEDNKNIIYSMIDQGQAPNVFKVSGGNLKKLTSDQFIQFNPVINNSGDYAYAVSKYSASISEVHLNGMPLIQTSEGTSIFKNLAISNKYLVFSEIRFYDAQIFLVIVDLDTMNFHKKNINNLVTRGVYFIDETNLLLHAYNKATGTTGVFKYSIINREITPVWQDGKHDIIVKKINHSSFILDKVWSEQEGILFFNTFYELISDEYGEPFARGNEFLGRLSWHQSFRLESYLALTQYIKNELICNNIRRMIKNIWSVTNHKLGLSRREAPPYTWASKKYSMSREKLISFLVDNSRIFYPLLVAINKGYLTDDGLKNEILEACEEMFCYFEEWYSEKESTYFFPFAIDFWADGIWLPFNQQNAWGLVLIELYKATGNKVYKERVIEIARKFKSEWIFTKDDRVLWHYWPGFFYRGWKNGEIKSVNTPMQEPREDVLFEDVSHAGINVKFILEFVRGIDKEIFSSTDLLHIKNTLVFFIAEGYSRFISGDKSYSPADLMYVPSYGWVELGVKDLNKVFYNLLPQILPTFEGHRAFDYINVLKSAKDFSLVGEKEIFIERRLFLNGALKERQEKRVGLDCILDYIFELDL